MKRFTLKSLLIFVTLLAGGLGLYRWLASPKPVAFRALVSVELEGETVYAPVWVYAVPTAYGYKAIKWTREEVMGIGPDKFYRVNSNTGILENSKGEPAFILQDKVTKVR